LEPSTWKPQWEKATESSADYLNLLTLTISFILTYHIHINLLFLTLLSLNINLKKTHFANK
jgi:hypothetical protein